MPSCPAVLATLTLSRKPKHQPPQKLPVSACLLFQFLIKMRCSLYWYAVRCPPPLPWRTESGDSDLCCVRRHVWKGAKFDGSVGHRMTKMLSASGGLCPPAQGLCPQTPVIGSCSALAMVPPLTPSATYVSLLVTKSWRRHWCTPHRYLDVQAYSVAHRCEIEVLCPAFICVNLKHTAHRFYFIAHWSQHSEVPYCGVHHAITLVFSHKVQLSFV